MNKNKIALKAQFDADTRFEVRPARAVSLDTTSDFERLKNRLFHIRLQETGEKWEASLRDAASEAAALAWTTITPSLVFPVLFEEKIAAVMAQTRRQERILKKSRELLAA
jgi:hypothetical protein